MGSVPDRSGDAIVLSLRRLNRIRAIDPANRTMTVEAGCILADIQAAAAAWISAKMQPAATVMVRLAGSIERMRFRRRSDSTMASPDLSGTLPMTRPVRPPCGTMGTPALAHRRTTAAT